MNEKNLLPFLKKHYLLVVFYLVAGLVVGLIFAIDGGPG